MQNTDFLPIVLIYGNDFYKAAIVSCYPKWHVFTLPNISFFPFVLRALWQHRNCIKIFLKKFLFLIWVLPAMRCWAEPCYFLFDCAVLYIFNSPWATQRFKSLIIWHKIHVNFTWYITKFWNWEAMTHSPLHTMAWDRRLNMHGASINMLQLKLKLERTGWKCNLMLCKVHLPE